MLSSVGIDFKSIMQAISLWMLPLMILGILTVALVKKVPIYEEFVEGAKEGVKTGLDIIPYLVAIITAVAMFRASGVLDIISVKFAGLLNLLHLPAEVLPMIFTRSLSGSASLGILSDIAGSTGADSYSTMLAAIIAGSSETTFYVLAVYFGSVGVKKFRHALLAGILADIFGVILAVIICALFF